MKKRFKMFYSVRMKKNVFLPLILPFFVLSGCGPREANEGESDSTKTPSTSMDGSSSSVGLLSSATGSNIDAISDIKAEGDQTSFFGGTESVSISLSFTNEALYDLSKYGGDQDTYWHKYDDVYFPADFSCKIGMNEYIYHDVGVRMKGATSRRTFADSQGNITNTVHLKINFKCTFDDELYDLQLFNKYKHEWDAENKENRKSRRFFAMDKLDVKYVPRNDSSFQISGKTYNCKSYNQELYSYKTFSDYDVPAPMARWINLSLSSEKMTKTYKYEAVECIDKRFLKRVFNENKGDLYKCTQVLVPSGQQTNPWGGQFDNIGTTYSATYANLTLENSVTSSFDENGYANGTRKARGSIGVEDNYSNYHPLYSLKTNDDAGEQSDFSKMAGLINALYSVRYKGAPYSLLDSVIDVDAFLKFAGISYVLGNYDDMRNNSNNYYIYFRKSDNKAVFIAYDFDFSLGLTRSETNYNIVTKSGMFSSKTSHNKTNKNNIYYDTIITNSGLSYYSNGDITQKTLQTTYKSYIKKAVEDGVLSYSNYTSFVSGLVDSQTSQSYEGDSVKKYMSDIKSTIDAVA